LDVVEGVSADSVFQNEVVETPVALTADSLDAVFGGGNQLANSRWVQEVLVDALGADRGGQVDGAVGHFGGGDALGSRLEFEGLVIAVRTDVFQLLVVNLAIGNDVVFVAESVVQEELIFADETDIGLVFVNEAILDVSLVAEIGLFLQVVPSAASQAGQSVIQVTGHLVSDAVGNLDQTLHSVIRQHEGIVAVRTGLFNGVHGVAIVHCHCSQNAIIESNQEVGVQTLHAIILSQ